jgi:hypothetical protein
MAVNGSSGTGCLTYQLVLSGTGCLTYRSRYAIAERQNRLANPFRRVCTRA